MLLENPGFLVLKEQTPNVFKVCLLTSVEEFDTNFFIDLLVVHRSGGAEPG